MEEGVFEALPQPWGHWKPSLVPLEAESPRGHPGQACPRAELAPSTVAVGSLLLIVLPREAEGTT